MEEKRICERRAGERRENVHTCFIEHKSPICWGEEREPGLFRNIDDPNNSGLYRAREEF